MDEKPKAVVLLSGGIDSSTCLGYYLDLGYDVTGLTVDYGHPANVHEFKAAKSVAEYYGVSLEEVTSRSKQKHGQGEIRGRNGFLIFTALLNSPNLKGILAMGIHSGTNYYDCSPEFAEQMEVLVSAHTDGQVVFDAPYVSWDKAMIYSLATDLNIPLGLTYSCEAGTLPACGSCSSCKDRDEFDIS